jgi:integrase
MSNTITVTKILEVYARIEKTRKLSQIVTTERLRRDYGVERMAIWETLQTILGHEEITETMDYVMKLAQREAEKKAKFETEAA